MPKKWPRQPGDSDPAIALNVWKCADCEAHDDTTLQVTTHVRGSMVGDEIYLPCPMCDGRAHRTSPSGLRSLHVLISYARDWPKQ